MNWTCAAILTALGLCAVLFFSLYGAYAQSSAPANSGLIDSARTKRKATEEEEMRRQKRLEEQNKKYLQAVTARNQKQADCRKQAKAQNLRLLKRLRFIKKCMAG